MSARKIAIGFAIACVILAVRAVLKEALVWEIDYLSVAYGVILWLIGGWWWEWKGPS